MIINPADRAAIILLLSINQHVLSDFKLLMNETQLVFSEQNTQNLRLTNENSAYAKQKASLDAQIKSYESSLAYTNTQDQNLLDTVATGRGTITLSWISVWEIIGLYLPEHWLAYLLVIVALITYLAHRRRARFAVH